MLTKQELLELIQQLPDDLEVAPLEITECAQEVGDWESQGRSTNFGGVYQRNIENILVLRIQFKTREQGEFRRTYTDPNGSFYNLRRI